MKLDVQAVRGIPKCDICDIWSGPLTPNYVALSR